MSLNKNYAVEITIAAVLIFVAAFMPWGSASGVPQVQTPFGNPFDSIMFPEIRLTFNGWNGHATVGGLQLPHWLVVVAAIGAVALTWLKVSATWSGSPIIVFVLAGYGLLHAGFVWTVLASSNEGSVGIGVLLTFAGFAYILVTLVRLLRHTNVVKSAELSE